MKNRNVLKWGLALVLGVLPFAGGCLQQPGSSIQQTQTGTVPSSGQESNVVAQIPVEDNTPFPEETAEGDISQAPVQALQEAAPFPENVKPTETLLELIRLAESGMEERVMLSFVTNSTGTFNLRSEEIVYLNDIGVPPAVVSAMLQHDHMLKGIAAEASLVALAPSSPTPAGQLAPIPDTNASAPGYAQPPFPQQNSFATETAFIPNEPVDAQDYASPPPAADVDYTTFHDSLAPYGTWVEVQGQGPCWQPSVVVVNRSWQPYFDRGCWVYTDCGWYWKSDYSWGWAPFHYGRWFRHSTLGWCWTPDNVWGPSWVSWRVASNYCGWAPLPPAAHFRPETGLTFHGRHVGANCDFGIAAGSFRFVDLHHFHDHHLAAHALPHDQVHRIFNHTLVSTRIVGNHRTVINHGIAPEQVAAATHSPVHKVNIHNVSAAEGNPARDRFEANGNRLAVFRPNLGHSSSSPAPIPPVRHGSFAQNPTVASASSPTIVGPPTPGQTSRQNAPATVIHEKLPGRSSSRIDRQTASARFASSQEPVRPNLARPSTETAKFPRIQSAPLRQAQPTPRQITQVAPDDSRNARTQTRHNTSASLADSSHRNSPHQMVNQRSQQPSYLNSQTSPRFQPSSASAQPEHISRQQVAPPREMPAPFTPSPAFAPRQPEPRQVETRTHATPAPAQPASPAPARPASSTPVHTAPERSSRPPR
jgi:hypothetical protein